MSEQSAARSFHGATPANEVEKVTFSGRGPTIKITNRAAVGSGSTASLFVRYDGEDPEINGDGSLVVLPGDSILHNVGVFDAPEVRVIAQSTVSYSAELGE